MDIERYFSFASTLPGATHDTPFGPDVLVFRIGGKMFALLGIERLPIQVNLKAEPERVAELQAQYEGALPAYHMNKQHWVAVVLQSDVPDGLIRELTEGSYRMIRASLPAGRRRELPDFD